MTPSPIQRKCKKCGAVVTNLVDLRKHYNEQHGGYAPKSHKKKEASPLDTIIEAEAMIRRAVQQLDQERTILSERLLALDDRIAKYRKII